jgi:hypothetical protein
MVLRQQQREQRRLVYRDALHALRQDLNQNRRQATFQELPQTTGHLDHTHQGDDRGHTHQGNDRGDAIASSEVPPKDARQASSQDAASSYVLPLRRSA